MRDIARAYVWSPAFTIEFRVDRDMPRSMRTSALSIAALALAACHHQTSRPLKNPSRGIDEIDRSG